MFLRGWKKVFGPADDDPNPKTTSKVLKAIANYTPSTDRGLSLKLGDKIEIECTNNVSNWRRAKNLRTKDYGYVDIHLLGENLEGNPWYFGDTTLYRAMVLLDGSKTGTYLVYERAHDKKIPYGLLLRTIGGTKSYGIYKERDTYQISSGFTSKSLEMLIQAYLEDKDLVLGLPTRLVEVAKLPLSNNLVVQLKDINRADIKIGGHLGSGFSSDVYRGKWKNKDVAVKSLSGNFRKEDFAEEVALLKKLKHENVVQFYGISTQLSPFYIVFEFLSYGDLRTYIDNHDFEGYQRIHIASQVARGMEYLANEGVVHRDLAARNILLQEKLVAKISDFGISRSTDKKNVTYFAVTRRNLPIKWLAPECVLERIFSEYSDVWAYSILLMEIYTRNSPYPEFKVDENNTKEFFDKIKKGHRMQKPDNMPDDIYDLCTQCWKLLPKLRLTFTKISRFFEKYVIDEKLEISDPFVITSIKRDRSKILPAILNYAPVTDRELELKVGDKIEIEDSNDDRRRAQNLRSKKFGYVDINYLNKNIQVKLSSSITGEKSKQAVDTENLQELHERNEPYIKSTSNLHQLSGNMSNVFKVTYRGELCTVKKLKNIDSDKKELINEALILGTLKHKNVIGLKGFCIDYPSLILLEYMENGDLKSFMMNKTLDNAQKCYVTYQLADGMAYLESKNIVHKDIAARNILLDSALTVKITGFRLARFMSENQCYQMLNIDTRLGLIRMAPNQGPSKLDPSFKFNSKSAYLLDAALALPPHSP